MIIRFVIAATALVAAPASAKVLSSDPHNFVIEHRVSAAAPPGAVWNSLGNIRSWWSSGHTYSGDAANLSLSLIPGGCLCERFPTGGGVEHLRVAVVEPQKKITLTGALGPLLGDAVVGSLDIRIVPSGGGSSIVVTYAASGFARGNGAKVARLVDEVIGEQARRLARAAAGPR